MNNQVTIYTDGSSLGNPGPGGFGVVLLWGPHRREIAQGYRLTTNNRMELLAVITALEALKRDGLEVTLFSDSKYVIDAVQKGWVFGWMRKGFAGKKNEDLWRRFLKVYARHQVPFLRATGHTTHHCGPWRGVARRYGLSARGPDSGRPAARRIPIGPSASTPYKTIRVG